LTESERSEERLLEAAHRVSGSDSATGLTGREQDGLWILDDEFWIVAEPLWRSSYALRDYGVTRWLVKEAEILDFGFWLNGASRLNLGAARRSAPTL
jgi:hypothetical protein